MATSFWNSVLKSCWLTIVSEFGDKTFFIVWIMSSRYKKLPVFFASITALAIMTIISSYMGQFFELLPSWLVHYGKFVYLLLTGFKMLANAYFLPQEEMSLDSNFAKTIDVPYHLGENVKIFLHIMTMLLIAEWGDKSQLNTIILVAEHGILSIGIGSLIGYIICCLIAIFGSKIMINSISIKTVTFVGGFTFISLAFINSELLY